MVPIIHCIASYVTFKPLLWSEVICNSSMNKLCRRMSSLKSIAKGGVWFKWDHIWVEVVWVQKIQSKNGEDKGTTVTCLTNRDVYRFILVDNIDISVLEDFIKNIEAISAGNWNSLLSNLPLSKLLSLTVILIYWLSPQAQKLACTLCHSNNGRM